MYCNDKACIKISDTEVTDNFEINQGVKQGCILSPLLFNIYMSDFPRLIDTADFNETNTEACYPSCLLWADDVVLLSKNEEHLKKMLTITESYCKENELTLNIEKTQCMIFNKSSRFIRKTFTFNKTKLETVRSYKYLGFIITPSGEILTGLKDLRDRGMKAFYKLKRSMGESFHQNITLTKELINNLIRPILLFASDFWGCRKLPKK